jgi:cyclopropane fatty-acyl-phospholipid synthase-like methyltransferase
MSHGHHANNDHAQRGDHAHGPDGHGEHAQHGGDPLVHRFTEGGEYWRARFEEPQRDASQRPAELVAAMGISEGMTVADIGAGTGYFMKHLARAVGGSGRVLALDIEPTMVRYMKERAKTEGLQNVEPHLVLTDDPLLPQVGVSRILIVNTWHHIPERVAYAKKLWEALPPGGKVFIVDFNMTTSRGPAKEHRLEAQSVLDELGKAGFEPTLDDKLLPDQYIAIGMRSREIR